MFIQQRYAVFQGIVFTCFKTGHQKNANFEPFVKSCQNGKFVRFGCYFVKLCVLEYTFYQFFLESAIT